MGTGNAAAVQYGPGVLRWAPLATAEPVSLSSTYAGGWATLGYTEKGSEFSYALTTVDLFVAEEYDPIKIASTTRSASVLFNLAEVTAAHLKLVLNGGTVTANVADESFDPPTVGSETRIMLAWDSDDGQERWIYRQALQSGSFNVVRDKGKLSFFNCTFKLEKPSGVQPFRAIFATARA